MDDTQVRLYYGYFLRKEALLLQKNNQVAGDLILKGTSRTIQKIKPKTTKNLRSIAGR
uniref:Uncharacterized protein n=1 Tax=Nelumbo nucifera TaxID=4432 RepID=A0A822XED2_NELNU|nr:TPA_asm: hypothetical protein HUJ06_019476 [Nelumbo nucifera]